MTEYKPDCAAVVFRKSWPDTCRSKAKVFGTFITHDGQRHRLGYCARHAKEIAASGEADTRNQRIEPKYPYTVRGTFDPDQTP